MSHPLAAVGCAALGLASGPLVPLLVRRLPPVEVGAPTNDHDLRSGDNWSASTEQVDVAAVAARRGVLGLAVLVAGAAAAAIGLALGWSWPLVYLLPMVPVSVALAVVDWHTRILPSRLILPTYPVVGLGVVASWLLSGRPDGSAGLVRPALGAAVVFGLFYLAWFVFPRGMGFGDVRLSGLLGLTLAALGWSELVVGMYAGFLLGGLVGGLLSLARVIERRAYPFGPFLCAGALVGAVAGRPVLALFAS